jgi:hypothetical protein
METLDQFILFWLLPALLTMLVTLMYERKINYRKPEKLNPDWWGGLLLAAGFYPIAWLIVLIDQIFPILIKERSLWD